MRMLIVLNLMLSVASVAAERWPPTLPVCELIAHRAEYNGKMVAVRGLVRGGGEGLWLVALPDCDYTLVTKGVPWPDMLFLVYPNNTSRIDADHAPFTVDKRAVEKADGDAIRDGFDPEKDDELVTYLGLFATYTDLERRVNANVPDALRLGFDTWDKHQDNLS